MIKISERAKDLKQSGIRAASVKCAALDGINLGQGVCDLPMDEAIKQGAYDAIAADKNMYSACEGAMPLRQAIAEKMQSFNNVAVDPATEILVSHGATGAFVCAVNTLFNPGDSVILFEPFYGYHRNILELHGINVETVPISLQDFSIDMDDLKKVTTVNTRGIIVCTPNNPTGKIFSKQELLAIGQWARERDLMLITDEMYEYITYPGAEHISLASLEDFHNRTVTISGFSKTYNMTGWRLGYACAPKAIMEKMALVQDLLYVCPATPLQYALLQGLALPQSYYDIMLQQYLKKRDDVVSALRDLGFKMLEPQGAYYLMVDFSDISSMSDSEFTQHLLDETKVAVVPGSDFYKHKELGQHSVRFCYALREEKVMQALNQLLQKLKR